MISIGTGLFEQEECNSTRFSGCGAHSPERAPLIMCCNGWKSDQ